MQVKRDHLSPSTENKRAETTNSGQILTFVEVHVLHQGVFGGERFGADGTHVRLFSGVYALVRQQSVLLGETIPTIQAAKGLLS